jgi:hypothetical protein
MSVRAKQSQFAPDRPKGVPAAKWQVLPQGTSTPNEANSSGATRGASDLQEKSYDELDPQKVLAKQSQFRDAQARARAGTAPVPPVGPVVQTKPICRHGHRWARAGEVTSGGVAWARCAKQTQFATDGQGRPSPRPEVLTMPPVGDKCAKQSQFAPDRPEGALAAGTVSAVGAGNKRAKQSQFPPVGPTPWIRNPPPYASHIPPFCGEPSA